MTMLEILHKHLHEGLDPYESIKLLSHLRTIANAFEHTGRTYDYQSIKLEGNKVVYIQHHEDYHGRRGFDKAFSFDIRLLNKSEQEIQRIGEYVRLTKEAHSLMAKLQGVNNDLITLSGKLSDEDIEIVYDRLENK